jgi:ComF family protein
MILNSIFNFSKEAVFPSSCVGCKETGSWLCPICQYKIIRVLRQICPYCGRLTKSGRLCSRCRPKSNLTGLIVAGYYTEGPLKEAICAFKYEFVTELLPYLSSLLARTFIENTSHSQKVLVPTPLSFWRRAYRGFDQAQLLAKEVSKIAGVPVENYLWRTGYRLPQVGLPNTKRRENVQGVFQVIKKPTYSRIVLVDDVFTTGATMEEAARVLRQAGVREVWGLVIAKG